MVQAEGVDAFGSRDWVALEAIEIAPRAIVAMTIRVR
jgi:hypothetical protein